MPKRGREFFQQRQQQAAGAGAEIENSSRRRTAGERRHSAASIRVSESGRGISVAGETWKSRLQNSRCPTIRASGSCATRRGQQGFEGSRY